MDNVQSAPLTDKQKRDLYGKQMKPIKATRVLVLTMSHDFGGQTGRSLIAIDDNAGQFTAVNTYGGQAKRGYDRTTMVHDLPAKDAERWKDWNRKGYKPEPVSDHPVLELVEAESEAAIAAVAASNEAIEKAKAEVTQG